MRRYKGEIFGFIYKRLLKPVFFMMDPEFVHDTVTVIGKILGENTITRFLTRLMFLFSNPVLTQEIRGVTFKNPIGLAAGFDKNAHLFNILPSVGFGFFEIGSVTGYPCEGNKKPRLWRLKQSKAIVVNYGLMNDGADAVAIRLKRSKIRSTYGVSIAMTNIPANSDISIAVADYKKALDAVSDLGSYLTINISCPNTCGGQPFKVAENLKKLFEKLQPGELGKPVFLKMSPDMTNEEIDAVIELARTFGVAGFICTNLLKDRSKAKIIEKVVPEKGGISGKVLENYADKMISYIYKKVGSEQKLCSIDKYPL